MADTVLFAGPSTWGLDPARFEVAEIQWRPPVRRGDIDRLVEEGREPGIVIVCDGVFQIAPAVSHAELCRAIDADWQVWGVSSIGAIRAFELRGEGMHGFGEVYAKFFSIEDFADDEMCLLHFPEPPFFPVSEPLVNVRHALEQQQRVLGISTDKAEIVIARLRELWFGDRTEDRIRQIMMVEAGIEGTRANALLAWLREHRLKSMDLENMLATRPWKHLGARVRTP